MKFFRYVLFVVLASTSFLADKTFAQTTFYVDPVNGNMAGDGSAANPWSTLEAVFSNNLIESRDSAGGQYDGNLVVKNGGAPVQAGDTIKLLSGYHGSVVEQAYHNSSFINIQAAAGHTPELSKFQIKGGSNWRLDGITFSPETGGTSSNGDIVHFETHGFHGPASNFVIENSTIYAASDTSAWSATDWTNNAGTGIHADGNNMVIRNNDISNVSFGIFSQGNDVLAQRNSILNFSADGMRGGGDRVTFEYNTIKWSYDVDGNHDDAIQFFRLGGSDDVVLRGNFIESYADPLHSLTHGAQGIGIFDGDHDNWLIENNVVMVADFHGISLYNATDSTIINNTVLDISGERDSWILLNESTNSLMRNNLAATFSVVGGSGIDLDHNLELNAGILDLLFEDWLNGDLSLRAGSSAIDAGSSLLAPGIDINGVLRPSGSGYDIGAYEFTTAVPEPSSCALLALTAMGALTARRRKVTVHKI